MKNTNLKVLFSILALGLLMAAGAGVLKQEVRFARTGLSTIERSGYDLVRLAGCGFTQIQGAPSLPVKPVSVLIPAGMEVTSVEVVAQDHVDLPGQYRIYPAQPPRPLPMVGVTLKEPPFVSPDIKIYSSVEPYPAQPVQFTAQGSLAGYEIAGVLVYPLQYLPALRTLRLFTRIEFEITYRPRSTERILPHRRSSFATETYQKMVRQIVVNPQDLTGFAPSILSSLALGPGSFEHVIIAAEQYRTHFQPLSDWFTIKGLPDTIVSLENIYARYTGRDNQERIRNFIIDAYKNWGTAWVLLGGDTDVLPARTAWAFQSGAGDSPDEDSLQCDLYYSDLDGTWDANHNNLFGEYADSIDMYPDVFVGRASINTTAEADNFVTKVLTYEKNPPLTNYPLKMMFMAYHLDSYTYSEYAKDTIDADCVPPRFDPITKLYEDNGAYGRDTAIAELNRGKNIINHIDHSNYDVMGCGYLDYGATLNNSDMDALSNGNKLSIIYTVGCWPAAIDYDCIAEHFVNAANGGGIAFVGNSRFGWYEQGDATVGSGEFDQAFFDCLFNQNVYHLGQTIAQSKLPFIAYAQNSSDPQNTYRWTEYDLNLLGEPALGTWTDAPATLTVTYPLSISTGSQNFTVTVAKSGTPVDSALVCVWKTDEVYAHGFTDAAGSVTLSIDPSSGGPMLVTVTAENGLPVEDTCNVQGTLVPDIKVTPDTLVFDCSGGSSLMALGSPRRRASLAALAPRSSMMLRRASLRSAPMPAAAAHKLMLASVLDTLEHTFDMPLFYWDTTSGNQNIFEVSCLTPARTCSLKTIQIAFYNPTTATATKGCSLYVWQDNAGLPGTLALAGAVTITLPETAAAWCEIDVSSQNLAFDKPFWIGHYEFTNAYPTSLFDTIPSPGDYYGDGFIWQPYIGDDLQRALVSYLPKNGLLDTMVVSNIGLETLAVTGMSPSQTWITAATPPVFNLAPSGAQPVAVTVDTTGLSDGVYRATISIASNDPRKNPYLEPVKLLKGPQPHIVVTPDTLAFRFDTTSSRSRTAALHSRTSAPAARPDRPSLTFVSRHGSARLFSFNPLATSAETMWVKNSGRASLDVTNITTGAAWVSAIQPTNFTVVPGDSQPVAVTATNDAGIAAGWHYDSLAISSNDPYVNPYYEPLKLFQAGPADIFVRPDTLLYDLSKGRVSMIDTIWVSNPGWDSLIVDADTKTPWIVGMAPKHLAIPLAESAFIMVRVDSSGVRGSATDYYGEILLHNNVLAKDPYHEPVRLVLPPRGIADTGKLPTVFELSLIAPNPLLFTRTAAIRYALPKTSAVSLKVYDLAGKLVKTLVAGIEPARFYTILWDSRDDSGRLLAKGVYFVRMDTPAYKKTRKLILIH